MMQNQFGEPAAPASSIQVDEEANVGIAVEDEQLNISIKKLQKMCRKTVTTAVVVASIVQSEAAQWVAKVEAFAKQEVGSGAEIISQTNSQVRKWFAEINQAVERVKNQSQSMEADLVLFAGTNVIEIEDMLEAIARVRKIIARIDYCQEEVEIKQAAMKQAKAALGEISVGAARETKAAAILATNCKLQVAAEQLKQAYLKQINTAVAVAKISQREATKWAAQVEKMLEHVEEAEIVAQTQVQVQEWLKRVNLVWVVEEALAQSYTTLDMVTVAKVAQVVVRDTVKVITGAKRILAQIEICQAEITAVKAARVAGQAERAAREMEAAAITAKIEVKAMVIGTKVEEKKKAAKEAREEAYIKAEAVARAKKAVEREARKVAEAKAEAAEEARRVAETRAIEAIEAKKRAEQEARGMVEAEKKARKVAEAKAQAAKKAGRVAAAKAEAKATELIKAINAEKKARKVAEAKVAEAGAKAIELIRANKKKAKKKAERKAREEAELWNSDYGDHNDHDYYEDCEGYEGYDYFMATDIESDNVNVINT
jgi:hypothetical protein